MRTYARLISVAFLSLGLMAGCATTEEGSSGSTAEQAIAAAKAANADAKAVGHEWRDTGKIIKAAEKALAAGNEEEATKLANKARNQAEDAVAQQKLENDKYLNSLSAADRAALASAEASLSKGSGAVAGRVSNYSVVRGDNLWDISGKDSVYANSYQWPLIYKTNRNKIKDADLIYPGQVFDIDQNASASEIDAAVRHAKTRGAWSVGDVEQSDLDYLAR
jgi:nucleoid-associated protein YgaU